MYTQNSLLQCQIVFSERKWLVQSPSLSSLYLFPATTACTTYSEPWLPPATSLPRKGSRDRIIPLYCCDLVNISEVTRGPPSVIFFLLLDRKMFQKKAHMCYRILWACTRFGNRGWQCGSVSHCHSEAVLRWHLLSLASTCAATTEGPGSTSNPCWSAASRSYSTSFACWNMTVICCQEQVLKKAK